MAGAGSLDFWSRGRFRQAQADVQSKYGIETIDPGCWNLGGNHAGHGGGGGAQGWILPLR